MSILKKLFGGSSSNALRAAGPASEPVAHEGYLITAEPIPEGSQFRLAGTISREIDGDLKTHRLVRADLFSSSDECVTSTIRKAKQVIAEQGDRMFA